MVINVVIIMVAFTYHPAKWFKYALLVLSTLSLGNAISLALSLKDSGVDLTLAKLGMIALSDLTALGFIAYSKGPSILRLKIIQRGVLILSLAGLAGSALLPVIEALSYSQGVKPARVLGVEKSGDTRGDLLVRLVTGETLRIKKYPLGHEPGDMVFVRVTSSFLGSWGAYQETLKDH